MSRLSRRARAQRRRPPFVAIGVVASLAILVVGALFVSGRWAIGSSTSLPLGTSNTIGSAQAPVEVEEWSDFQ